MATLEEAKNQISQAKQRIQEQRTQVTQRREEARTAESELLKQKQKLPKPTQRLLRTGMFTGLEGRKRLRQVKKVESQIIGKQKEVGEFKGELTKYEQEQIVPFEQQVSQAESQISSYENKIRDYDYGYKMGLQRTFTEDFNDIQRKGYWDARNSIAFYEGIIALKEQEGINAGINQLSQIESPSINKIIFPKGVYNVKTKTYYNPAGVPSSIDITEAKNIGASFTFVPPSINKLSPPRDLGLTSTKKDFVPLNKLNLGSIPSGFDSVFLTTGSPKRFTPLLSSIPKRPPTPKPSSFKSTTKIKVQIPKETKPKKKKTNTAIFGIKKEKDIFFGSKKKKKKRNIWGF